MPNRDRYFRIPRGVLPVLTLVLVGLILASAIGRADDAIELSAGEPTVLKHPAINKSVGNPVHCLAFLDEGVMLATGATSGVLIWDVKKGNLKQTLQLDDRAVDTLLTDPAGTQLIAGGATGIIKVWDARTFKLLQTLGPAHGAVRGLSISSDGKYLASASPNGLLEKPEQDFHVIIWDMATGKPLQIIPHPTPAFGSTALAFTPDQKQLVSAQDREFRLMNLENGKITKTIDLPDLPRSLGSLAIGKDGRLVSGVFEPAIRVWDSRNWQQVLTWPAHDQEPPPRRGVSTVNFSPDGKFILSGGMDDMVSVWDASSGRRLLNLDGRGDASRGWITGVAMTPDGESLAATHYGGTATIWRITTNK